MIAALFEQSWHAIMAAPLVGAGLALLTPHARLSWAIGVLALIGVAGGAFWLSLRGDMNEAGGLAAFALPSLCALGALCLLAGAGALHEINSRAAPFAIALAILIVGAWSFALTASDWIGLAVAVEAAWLASVGLVALGDARRGALNGAMRMLVHGGASAALMLLGVGFVMRATLRTEIGALAEVENVTLGIVGLVLVLASLGVKAGLAPLHAWAGAAFGRGGALPVLVVSVIGAVGAVATMVRVGAAAAASPEVAASVFAMLASLGAVSIVIGSVQAIGATDLRRLAAYAFASQAGCVLLSASLGSPAGLAASVMQLIALSAAMLALVGATAATRDSSRPALDGLIRRYPIAALALTAGALSLMGAPLTIGFLGRWRLIEAAVGAGWWWVAGTALLSSLAAVFYGGRLIERIYFRRATAVASPATDPWRVLTAPALIVAALVLAMGVEPSLLLQVSAHAAAVLSVAP